MPTNTVRTRINYTTASPKSWTAGVPSAKNSYRMMEI